MIEFGYDRDHVFFHISDEPGMDCLESYKAARESVKESLKGWQVVDALSEYSFYEKGIVQHPIVSSNHISVFLKNKVPQPWVWAVCYSTESLFCNAKLAKSYYGSIDVSSWN